MSTRLPLDLANPLEQLTIASPCSARWQDMPGDEHVRSCSHCQQRVYNLSALTAAEAIALIREKEGHLCVGIYRRADGTILTNDCPVGLRQFARKQFRRVAAFASFLLAMVLSGCQYEDPRCNNNKRQLALGASCFNPKSTQLDDVSRSDLAQGTGKTTRLLMQRFLRRGENKESSEAPFMSKYDPPPSSRLPCAR
jgi:hypothetical protein